MNKLERFGQEGFYYEGGDRAAIVERGWNEREFANSGRVSVFGGGEGAKVCLVLHHLREFRPVGDEISYGDKAAMWTTWYKGKDYCVVCMFMSVAGDDLERLKEYVKDGLYV